jgi:hypothetical protein
MEKISADDKLAIFRIAQTFIKLLAVSPQSRKISIGITYQHPRVEIRLVSNKEATLNLQAAECRSLRSRVEYFAGEIWQTQSVNENCVHIKFSIPEVSAG